MQRVAIIGAGGMGRAHANAYAQICDAELVAVSDIRLVAAQELANQHSARAFASFNEMLAESDFDVVDICSPTPSHFEYIAAAAKNGKHVCCEKPLGRTVTEAEDAVDLCREAGVTLFVGHVLRWFPEFRKLHDLIQDGVIGTPVTARTSRGGVQPRGWDDWFIDTKRSGGVVLDLIIHDYDWLRWCFGRVTRVYARGLTGTIAQSRDYALVTLRFENGVIAHVEGSWARPSGFVTSAEIAGTKGLLSFSSRDAAPVLIERKIGDESCVTHTTESPVAVSPYYLELRHFIECLEHGRVPDVKPEDGIEAVRIGEAAARSIKTGQPIALA